MRNHEGWGFCLALIAVNVLVLGQAAQALPYLSRFQQTADPAGQAERLGRELVRSWAGKLGMGDRELSLALAWAERSPLRARLDQLRVLRTRDGKLALDLARLDRGVVERETRSFAGIFPLEDRFPALPALGTSRLGLYPSAFSGVAGPLAVSEKMVKEQLAALGMDPAAVTRLLSGVSAGDLRAVPQGVTLGWGAGDAEWKMKQYEEQQQEKKRTRLLLVVAFVFLALIILIIALAAGGAAGVIAGVIAFVVLIVLAIFIMDKGEMV